MRTILAGLLAASSIMAVEADAKAQAAQARTVWSEAAKQGDPWTCLQLEAWGRERKPAVRLGSALGDTTVVGEVRFAAPATLSHLTDLGDRVVIATPERAFVLAPDGRPLQPSIRLVPATWYQATSYAGQAMGLVSRTHTKDRTSLEFCGVSLADGKQIMRTTLDLTATQHWGEEVVVADDGSAIASIVVSEEGDDRRRTRNVAVAAGKGARIEPACRDPFGVGRNGDWLLARGLGDDGPLLIRGGKRQPILAGATGSGLAAYIVKDKAQLLLRDGKEVPLNGAPVIGQDPALVCVGEWLVLGSGHGAKVVSEGDLLGENAGSTVEQPAMLAMWRWADLVANPAAKPVQVLEGALSTAAILPAALWIWQGQSLDLIDLAGEAPVRTHYFDAPGTISWAGSDMHCLRLEMDKPHRFALYGPDKSELWSGDAYDVQVKRRDLALVEQRQGKEGRVVRSLQWLSADPAKRRSVVVALPPEANSCQVSVSGPDLVLGRGPNRAWWTAGFDGKAIASGDGDGPVARPDCPEWNWYAPTGRFYREGARIYDKTLGPPVDPLQRLQLMDAWRVGANTMLLQPDGRVLVSGRKRGEWVDVGAVEGAQRFGLRGAAPVLIRDEAKMVAMMAPGPRLQPDGSGTAIELPVGGPWRLMDNGRFTPPRGRQLQWDGERLGWSEARLRSPDGAGMFVITASVLLELDPDAARFFGK